MEIIDDKLYKFKAFRDYLGELGLPNSRPYILRLEKDGLIESPRLNDGTAFPPRIYTGAQIRKCAEAIKAMIR